MSHSASVSKSQAASVDPSPRKRAAQYLAETMLTGSCPNDRSFDRFLPEPLRLVSPEYWTPLAVAKRAAEWFEDLGIRTVVDIGSGAGKFCVAGALFGKCRFIGLEKYSSLVTSARTLADLFDLTDRVSFVAGALGSVTAPVGDAYYLFNPFGDYWLGADYPLEAGAEFTDTRYSDDVSAAEDLLRRAPSGTWVLTYNGFGGRIYIDPPFNSNRNYEVFWGETKEKRAFDDRHASTEAYVGYMRPRCEELHRTLKPTGSFYYHCDWHASHYVRVMLDQILGENNFQSEIIWHRTMAKGLSFTGFPNNHDTIFLYGGGGKLTFNRPYDPYDPDNLDEK